MKCVGALALAMCTGACVTAGQAPGRTDVGDAIRSRTGVELRGEVATTPSLPPGASLDALTREDAVAIALWNSPSFGATLTALGLARADLAEARLLRNPILSLLFPIGTKQLEWTLQYPLEVLWQRPRRVAAATLNARAVGERLVYDGLALVASVRTSFIETAAGDRRVELAAENATLIRRIATIADARLRAGDISDREARAPKSDAAQAEAEIRSLEHEREAALLALIAGMGLDTPPADVQLAQSEPLTAEACPSPEALVEDAVASRPDVRAAEIAIEAAAARLSWERSRVVNLMAMLDANGRGAEADELGPGLSGELPIFSRNQGPISRAEVELERASLEYVAVRTRVAAEVRSAAVRVAQARDAMASWANDIIPSLEIEQRASRGRL